MRTGDMIHRRIGEGWEVGFMPNTPTSDSPLDCRLVFDFRLVRDLRFNTEAEIFVSHLGTEIAYNYHLKIDDNRSQSDFAENIQYNLTIADPQLSILKLLSCACRLVIIENRVGNPIVFPGTDDVAVEQLQYAVHPLMPKGETTLMYGDSKSCKSYIALYVAFNAAAGNIDPLAAGLQIEEPTRVLYLDWETNENAIRYRLSRIARGLGTQVPIDFGYRQMTRPILEDLTTIRRQVDEQNFRMVVIDSIGAACGRDMNDGSAISQVMSRIRELPASKLVIHHITNASAQSQDTKARPYGSVYFRALARANWSVKRSQAGADPNAFVACIENAGSNDFNVDDKLNVQIAFDSFDGPVRFSTGRSLMDESFDWARNYYEGDG